MAVSGIPGLACHDQGLTVPAVSGSPHCGSSLFSSNRPPRRRSCPSYEGFHIHWCYLTCATFLSGFECFYTQASVFYDFVKLRRSSGDDFLLFNHSIKIFKRFQYTHTVRFQFDFRVEKEVGKWENHKQFLFMVATTSESFGTVRKSPETYFAFRRLTIFPQVRRIFFCFVFLISGVAVVGGRGSGNEVSSKEHQLYKWWVKVQFSLHFNLVARSAVVSARLCMSFCCVKEKISSRWNGRGDGKTRRGEKIEKNGVLQLDNTWSAFLLWYQNIDRMIIYIYSFLSDPLITCRDDSYADLQIGTVAELFPFVLRAGPGTEAKILLFSSHWPDRRRTIYQ